jgi:histidinol dehydrogenase
MTFQHITPEGIRRIGPAVELMAAGEQLDAHRQAMSLRLRQAEAADGAAQG